MLVLSRKTSEIIYIGDDIQVMVVRIGDGSVRIGVTAPRHIDIRRDDSGPKKDSGDGSRAAGNIVSEQQP